MTICDRLLVSHGCVSKILSRYYETGSTLPGTLSHLRNIRGNRTKVIHSNKVYNVIIFINFKL